MALSALQTLFLIITIGFWIAAYAQSNRAPPSPGLQRKQYVLQHPPNRQRKQNQPQIPRERYLESESSLIPAPSRSSESRGSSRSQDSTPSSSSPSSSSSDPAKRAPAVKGGKDELQTLDKKPRRRAHGGSGGDGVGGGGGGGRPEKPAPAPSNPNTSYNDPFSLFMKLQQHRRAFASSSSGTRNLGSRSGKVAQPNVVVVLCDDLDVELGSLEFMPKTMRILRDGGANFKNAFTSTPMCCPSRSSFLTGLYVHNHDVYTNNDNCSGTHWRKTHESRSFATYLSKVGYRTGYFGKYLNDYDGSYVPPGWREWVGLIRNSRFYNYSINFNGRKIKHGNDYFRDYFTDLIVNDSVTFLKQSKQYFPDLPVAMVLSMPAPHGPEDAAPQHQHLFPNVTTHKTPAYNFAPNMDKQWLLQWTGKMEPIQKEFTNMLHRKRLQTLQAVDDAVQKIHDELKALNQLENTYMMFTSDHGYHLGQFGLVKGKAMPYEFDIKIPLLIRGPTVPKGVVVDSPVMLLDVAPTILDLAGVEAPEHFDGRSVMKLLESTRSGEGVKKRKAWRDTILIERGKITLRQIKARETHEFGLNSAAALGRGARLSIECQKEQFRVPCKKGQKWFCKKTGEKWRMIKCKNFAAAWSSAAAAVAGSPADLLAQQCVCPPPALPVTTTTRRKNPSAAAKTSLMMADSSDSSSPHLQRDTIKSKRQRWKQQERKLKRRNFTRKHQRQPRWRRNDVHKQKRRRFRRRGGEGGGVSEDLLRAGSASPFQMCHVLANETVVCDRRVYSTPQAWRRERENVEEMIERYRVYINHLKHIRKHLKYISYEQKHEIPTAGGPSSSLSSSSSSLPSIPISSRISPSFPRSKNRDNLEFQVFNPSSANDGNETEDAGMSHRHRPDLDSSTSGKRKQVLYSTGSDGPSATKEESAQGLGDDSCDCGDQERNFRRWRKRNPWWQLQHGGNGHAALAGRKRKKESADGPILNGGSRVFDDRDGSFRQSEQYLLDMLPPVQPPYLNGKDRYFSWNNIRDKDLAMLNGQSSNVRKMTKKERKKIGKDKHFECNIQNMNCFKQDNDHWKVPPLWTLGPFCSCPNSNNNTYWCTRTINSTHNFLYCEFITGFISYYNILTDPYQLRNAVHDLDYGVLQQLHKTLNRLRACKGKECNIRNRPGDSGMKNRRSMENSSSSSSNSPASSSSSSSHSSSDSSSSFFPSNPWSTMKREPANLFGLNRRKEETVVRVDLSKARSNVNNYQHRSAPMPNFNSSFSSSLNPSTIITRTRKNIIE